MRYNLLFQVNHSLATCLCLKKMSVWSKICYLHKITIKKLLSPLSIIELWNCLFSVLTMQHVLFCKREITTSKLQITN
jgi:hypothetical protein